MRRSWWQLAPESARIALSNRVVSGLVVLLATAVPIAVLGTAGRSVDSQAAIMARVDESGARIMTLVSSSQTSSIPARAVDRIASLSGVEWVVGLGPVFDARTPSNVGDPTPARAYRGVRAPVRFSQMGDRDGAFVSASSSRRLGIDGAYSVLDPDGVEIVGWFDVSDPISGLKDFVLIPNQDDHLALERIIVAVKDVGWVDPVAAVMKTMVGTSAGTSVTLNRSQALLDARAAVGDEVARRDREFVIALLGAATALACVVVFAGTVSGRRDFGRRRALGATQGQLVLIVMMSTLWPAGFGAAIGTASGYMYLGALLGHVPGWQFPVAVGTLTVLALLVSSVVPAWVASTRDPLRVLRMP